MFPTGWTRQHAIQSDPDKVSGTANLTDFPSLLTEANFQSSIFSNSQGKEINSNYLLNDANLQGYWKLESDGTDETANGYDLTGTAPTYTTGYFGNGGDFEASSSQYLAIADASCANLEISGSQTWSAWVKKESDAPAAGYRIFSKGKLSNANARKDIFVNVSQQVVAGFYDGSTRDVVSNATLNNTDWYHIVAVYNATAQKIYLYINGVLDNTGTAGSSTTDSNAPFAIGCSYFGASDTPSSFFDGIIDDVAIWDRALSDAEVKAIYTGGADLRFTTDEAGTNQIPHEVVNWDIDNSEAEVWVKIPTLSYNTATTIYVWSGNSSAVPLARNDTYGSDNVWDSNYKLVVHDPYVPYDSTSNNHTLSSSGTNTVGVGKIGGARDYNGSTDYNTVTTSSALNNITSSVTVQSWTKYDSITTNTSNARGRIDKGNNQYLLQQTTSKLEFVIWQSSSAKLDNRNASGGTTLTTGTWYQSVGRYNGSTLDTFVNGSLDRTANVSGSIDSGTNNLWVGAYGGGPSNYHDGLIDEVRVSSVARSADWIATEYNNQNSPSTFWIELTNYTDELTDTITLADSISRGVTYNRGTVSAITLADNVDRYSIYTRNISTEGSNIILNPSFEDGDIDNWTLNGGGVTVVQKSSTYANSGTYSLRVLSISPISSANGESDYTNVSSSTTYNLSFYCRKDISDSNATYRVIGYDSGDNPTDLISTTAINTTAGSFVQVTDTFTTASDTVKIKVFLAVTTSTGDIYYDDVSVFQEGSDTISVTDNIDYEYTAGTIIRSLLSSLTITDNLDRQINYIREQLSGLTATDTINRQQNSIRGLINTLTLADNIDNSVLSLFLVNLSSSLSIGDNIDKTTSYSKQLLEAINVAENLVRNVDYSRVLSGSITITDSLDFVNLLSRELTSALSIGDNLDRVLNINVTLSDGISLDDALDIQNTLNRSIESSLILGDNIDATIVLSRSLTSGITVADSLDFTFVINRDLSDTITLTDTIDRVARYIGKSIASIGEIDTIKPTIQGVEKTKGTTYKIDKDRPILYSIRKG